MNEYDYENNIYLQRPASSDENERTFDIYVINLENNTDRKELILNSLKSFKNLNIYFFKAIYNPNGAIGCCESHKTLCNYAKNKNLNYIIVFEDDNELLVDTNEFTNILIKLADNYDKYKIFNGFPTCNIHKKLLDSMKEPAFDPEFNFIKFGLTTNFIIYTTHVYNEIISLNSTNTIIDCYINFYIKQLTTIKQIARQKENLISTITGRRRQYNNNILCVNLWLAGYNISKQKLLRHVDKQPKCFERLCDTTKKVINNNILSNKRTINLNSKKTNDTYKNYTRSIASPIINILSTVYISRNRNIKQNTDSINKNFNRNYNVKHNVNNNVCRNIIDINKLREPRKHIDKTLYPGQLLYHRGVLIRSKK